jgi:hypothetical protein
MDYKTTTTTGVGEHFVRAYKITLDDLIPQFQLDIAPENFPDAKIIGDRFQLFTVENMSIYANPVGNPIHRSSNLVIGVNSDSGNNLVDTDLDVYSSNILRLKSSKLLNKDSVGQLCVVDSFRRNYYTKPVGLRRLEVPLVINAVLQNITPVVGKYSPWLIYLNVHFKFFNPTLTVPDLPPTQYTINFANATAVNSTDSYVEVTLPGQTQLVDKVKLTFDQNVSFTVSYATDPDGSVDTNVADIMVNTGEILILKFLGTQLSADSLDSLSTLASIQSNGTIQAIAN